MIPILSHVVVVAENNPGGGETKRVSDGFPLQTPNWLKALSNIVYIFLLATFQYGT